MNLKHEDLKSKETCFIWLVTIFCVGLICKNLRQHRMKR